MKEISFFLLLIFFSLIQIAWGPWLSFLGFAIPLSLLMLLMGIKWFEAPPLLIFAFFNGLFYDLVSSETLGIMALLNTMIMGVVLMLVKK